MYAFILVIVLMQSLLLLGHWLLYRTVIRFLDITNPAVIMGMRIGLTVLSLSFVLASLLVFKYHNQFVKLFYVIASSWLGFFYYLAWAVVLLWFLYGVAGLIGWHVDFRIFAAVLIAAAVATGTYGIINAREIRVKKIDVSLPNLPDAWKNKTVVWTSDLHLGAVRGEAFSRKVAALIDEQHPDIVFIGGDLFDGVAGDYPRLAGPMAKLNAPQGTYFITGNHEEFNDKNKFLSVIKELKINILDNQMVDIDGIQVVGVDYKDSENKMRYHEILSDLKIDRSKPSILLKHAPDLLATAESFGISLQLSGHTHVGQVWPNKAITRKVFKGFDYGFKRYKDMAVNTSSGTGTWGLPMRVGANPEIVVIRFE
ncbi:MAG: metallophosphoesterase [Candidatus Saccharibacteria bacterium]